MYPYTNCLRVVCIREEVTKIYDFEFAKHSKKMYTTYYTINSSATLAGKCAFRLIVSISTIKNKQIVIDTEVDHLITKIIAGYIFNCSSKRNTKIV